MRNRVLILGAVIASAVVIVAFLGVPFWISNGTFGRTFLDKPSFSVVAIYLAKNGTDCYLRSTVWNSGNIYINRLTLNLNNTYVFSDGRIAPNTLDDNWQRFHNYGSFHCADIRVDQTYTATFLSEFADGVDQSASKMLGVGSFPIPPPPS